MANKLINWQTKIKNLTTSLALVLTNQLNDWQTNKLIIETWVLTAGSTIFLYVTSCSLVETDRYFGGKNLFHL
jgi:hypothetical protein